MIKFLLRNHKAVGILTSFLFLLLVLIITLLGVVNYYLIPKIVIPKVTEYIKKNLPENINLSISDISFHLFQGFQLHDVDLSGSVFLNNSNSVLFAKEIDVDLSVMSLLRRNIDIMNMELYGANIHIGRDSDGKWNCENILNIMNRFHCNTESKLCSVSVGQFIIRNSSVEYIDSFNKDNKIEKKFVGVTVSYKQSSENIYTLLIDGHIDGDEQESIGITINNDVLQNKMLGVLKFRVASLMDYWEYYLDHLFNPWNLSAKDVGINLSFVYENDALLLDGQYTLGKGSLRYGKLDISGKAVISHLFTLKNGIFEKDMAIVGISFENATVSAGNNNILKKGACKAEMKGSVINFMDISGLLFDFPVSMQGHFSFDMPQELFLNGEFLYAENEFNLKLISDNKADALWKINKDDTEMVITLKVDDIENLKFDSEVKGKVFLNNIIKDCYIVSGGIDLSGNLFGNLDNILSLNGNLKISGNNLLFFNGAPANFYIDTIIKDGVLNGSLSNTEFCGGEVNGSLYIDENLWAGQLNIKDIDLNEFSKVNSNLQGIKGSLGGNFVCGAGWEDPDSITGGGYLKLEDAFIWDAPVFLEISKGMSDKVNISNLEKFRLLEGNCVINKDGVNIDNVFCDMPSIKMNIKGRISFEGEVNFIVGVVVSAVSLVSDMRNILKPQKIISDLFSNCVDIHIEGKWPNLQQYSEVRALAFFNSLFPLTGNRADPNLYSLEKYLSEYKK